MLSFFSTYDSHSNDDIVECFDNLYDKLSEVHFLFSLFGLIGTKIML